MSNKNKSSTIDSIHHVAISVANIDQAIHWYTTSFACNVIRHEKTHAVIEFANIMLALVLPSQEPPHLAFVRPDAATLGELREKNDGSWSTFISDSSGNLVEILAPQETNS